MKKFIIILSVLLIGVLTYMSIALVSSETDELYTDATQQSSIDKAIKSFVSEPDVELRLTDDYILNKVAIGKATYYLVLLPYEDNERFAGFVMRTEERKGKWKTDRMSALYNVRPTDKSTISEATYIYDSIIDPDNDAEIYFALGNAPDDTNATALGERVVLDSNGIFGVISTEQFSIYQ